MLALVLVACSAQAAGTTGGRGTTPGATANQSGVKKTPTSPPRPANSITEYPVPSIYGASFPSNSAPVGITSGPDRNLWFTDQQGRGKIGRITPAGQITEFSLPSLEYPGAITAGPDGALWFLSGSTIGRITPDGKMTEFATPPPRPTTSDITAGPDGALWFTEPLANQIGRITTGGSISEFNLPTATNVPNGDSGPSGITAGPDGALWFTEQDSGKIGRITPAGQITEFPLPSGEHPGAITAGPGGALWFMECALNPSTHRCVSSIGRISPNGQLTEFSIPTVPIQPSAITAGPDGNLWFTECDVVDAAGSALCLDNSQIERMTPAGQFTAFPLADAKSDPGGITAGPDGALWFTEQGRGKIGRIMP